MPSYIYHAFNENGNKVSGTLDADSVDAANSILALRGLIPLKMIQEQDKSADNTWSTIMTFTNTVRASDLIIFTKQFRSMLSAGVPILRLLQVLEAQTESRVLRKAISIIVQDIRQGSSLSEALQKYPKIFSPLYCAMIKAGEISGNVPGVLDRLIYIIEHETKVKADIKAALRYPMIVVIALGIAFIILLTFVIPQFVSLFSKAGIDLPWPTKIAMFLYTYLKNYWYIILTGVGVIIFGLYSYFQTQNGKLLKDTFILEIPILGPLFKKAALSRFASIFAILQTSGVPVMQSLTILSETIGNAAISRAFEHVRERIEEGAGISAPLKTVKYFTPMVIDMIAIGEESGNIDEMLREISKHYDDEVEYAVKGLSDAIGPILIIGLAAVVGFFALAIFMPIWDLTKLATHQQ
ncbi:MAG: type II secretion system F family protein [Smithellaceae bacterium]|jgi:type IV pilus assembly protein PilC